MDIFGQIFNKGFSKGDGKITMADIDEVYRRSGGNLGQTVVDTSDLFEDRKSAVFDTAMLKEWLHELQNPTGKTTDDDAIIDVAYEQL